MPLQNKIAIIFDCDGTLCEDSTDFVLEKCGMSEIDIKRFWRGVNKMVKEGWDPPLAYMHKIIELVNSNKIRDLSNKKLREIGRELNFFPGVLRMFSDFQKLLGKEEFRDAGIKLEFYIISGGLEEVIKGSKIRRYMKDIFGCTFYENPESGLIMFPQRIVTFTEKTKFIFAINKGTNRIREDPYQVNDVIEDPDRRIPLPNMIYVGDGPSDISCMSLIGKKGGRVFGLNKKPKRGYELKTGRREVIGPYLCDFTKRGSLRRFLKEAIKEIARRIVLEKQKMIRAPRP